MKSKFVKNSNLTKSKGPKNRNKFFANKHQQLGRKILSGTNLIIVSLNLFSILYYGLRLENFIVILISAVLFYVERKNLPEAVFFVLAYPLSWLFFIPLKNEEIEDFFTIPLPPEIRLNINETVKSVLPVKATIIIGNTSEKKAVTRKLVTYITHGINVEENMKYLRMLQKDPHMDVALYAGQALEDIENYFEEQIAKSRNINDIESCLTIYNYLRTGIPKGALRQDLENLLRTKIENVSNRLPQYYEIMYYLEKDENYFLIGYEKTKEPSLLKKYLLEKLRKREYSVVKAYLSETTRKLICEN
ncbi:hypothetical protein QO062_01190 [Fervidobacterium pennivorans subsp. carthaginiensis]|jgi:hypothetical protein|uniref:hypothetical protein n=1 Tax=Fervidobacterium pennivorans TaxID=93466 RepID=UPI00355B1798